MTAKKEEFSSDTLERSNISSLQSDNTAKKNSLENNNVNPDKFQNCFCQPHAFNNIKFIPCPIMNTNFEPIHYSGQCLCQRFQLNESNLQRQNDNENNTCKWKWPRNSYTNKNDKYYDIKSKNKKNNHRKACCEVLDGAPKNEKFDYKNILESPFKDNIDPTEKIEKIEIYYFDHGNSAYYHTTDIPPVLKTDKIAETAHTRVTRFWAEIFGGIHIIASFLTVFILQFLRCILFSMIRPLIVGVIQMITDYFIKPLLSTTFNGFIQPFLILFYNMATSIRDCSEPLAEAFGFYIKEVAVLLQSCRLIEINHNYRNNVNV